MKFDHRYKRIGRPRILLKNRPEVECFIRLDRYLQRAFGNTYTVHSWEKSLYSALRYLCGRRTPGNRSFLRSLVARVDNSTWKPATAIRSG